MYNTGIKYKELFTKDLKEVKPTDMVEHTIDLLPNARPVISKSRLYTQKERDFASQIFRRCARQASS